MARQRAARDKETEPNGQSKRAPWFVSARECLRKTAGHWQAPGERAQQRPEPQPSKGPSHSPALPAELRESTGVGQASAELELNTEIVIFIHSEEEFQEDSQRPTKIPER
jgi:hypothetical protein